MALRELTGGLVHTPFLSGLPNLIAEKWRIFFSEATEALNTVPAIVRVEKANQTAAVPLTSLPATDLPGGLYRVSVYTKIMTPASINSSVTPSVTFTDSAATCTFTGTANTGNTVQSVTCNTFLIRITQGTPISYSTAYASNLAGMAYDAEFILEQISG